MNNREQCGAEATLSFMDPDMEPIDAVCWLRARHEGPHEDLETAAKWGWTDGE